MSLQHLLLLCLRNVFVVGITRSKVMSLFVCFFMGLTVSKSLVACCLASCFCFRRVFPKHSVASAYFAALLEEPETKCKKRPWELVHVLLRGFMIRGVWAKRKIRNKSSTSHWTWTCDQVWDPLLGRTLAFDCCWPVLMQNVLDTQCLTFKEPGKTSLTVFSTSLVDIMQAATLHRDYTRFARVHTIPPDLLMSLMRCED